jgi:hypothetical protein
MQGLNRVVIDRAQEVDAHSTAFALIQYYEAHNKHANQYNRALNYHEMIAEKAEGYGAQIAVANFFGDYSYKPKLDPTMEHADVGTNIEVKYTHHENGHLVIQDRYKKPERLKDIGILVVGKSPVYYLVGWMPVAMAMQPRYRVSWDKNYWVPKSSLFEMKYLKRSDYGNTAI